VRLATRNNGTRDGELVVVSRDLAHCSAVGHIAPNLQSALDDWENAAPRLERVAAGLETGAQPMERYHESQCLSPLPRAYQWLDGSAYVNHVELVRKARGADMPERFWTDPLMYQGGSDTFLGSREPIRFPSEAFPEWGVDMEAEVAVITGDVPMGTNSQDALGLVRLVLLCNDVSLRGLIPDELSKGFGFVQSKPSCTFSPVAVTPIELGDAWGAGRLHGALRTWLNGQLLGEPNAGEDMVFGFGELISHAAKTRDLTAGTVIGSGTVSNKGRDGEPGLSVAKGGLGYSCIAEQRTVETLIGGDPLTPFLKPGDTVRIEMMDTGGSSLFGAIEQRVEEH